MLVVFTDGNTLLITGAAARYPAATGAPVPLLGRKMELQMDSQSPKSGEQEGFACPCFWELFRASWVLQSVPLGSGVMPAHKAQRIHIWRFSCAHSAFRF